MDTLDRPYFKTSFLWALHFSLYLCSQRTDIDPMDSYNLGFEYIEMLPNLLRVSPYDVVDEYLKGEYP